MGTEATENNDFQIIFSFQSIFHSTCSTKSRSLLDANGCETVEQEKSKKCTHFSYSDQENEEAFLIFRNIYTKNKCKLG